MEVPQERERGGSGGCTKCSRQATVDMHDRGYQVYTPLLRVLSAGNQSSKTSVLCTIKT